MSAKNRCRHFLTVEAILSGALMLLYPQQQSGTTRAGW